MLEKVRELWVWWALGALLGIVGTASVVPYGIHQYERQAAEFDSQNPVVQPIENAITRRDGDAIEVRVVAKRIRNECRFDRAAGASEDALGRLTAIYIQRLGPGPTGVSYPEGTVVVSDWRLWPTTGAAAVHVIGLYQCDGRPVSDTVARVPLQ